MHEKTKWNKELLKPDISKVYYNSWTDSNNANTRTNAYNNANANTNTNYARTNAYANINAYRKRPYSNICFLDNDIRFQSFMGRKCNTQYRKPFIHKKIGAGGIVIDKNGKLLVVKGTSKWSLPKGHLELGEKYHECAMREIEEEVGLKVKLEASDRYLDVKKCVYYIIVLNQDGPENLKTNDPKEISDIKWLSIQEIKYLDCNRQLDYVIDRWDYIQNIIKNSGHRTICCPILIKELSSNESDDMSYIVDEPNLVQYFVPDFSMRPCLYEC